MSADRFSLSAEEYLGQTHVLTYIEDAVSQLLEYKEEHSKIGITRFLAEYFTSVKHGSHILFREFSFVKATPYNRASFIRMFWQCFRQIGKNGDLLTVMEYHSLLQLICHDFPMDLAQRAARIILMDDAMDCPMSFVDFLYAFQIQFYYCEFLESIAIIYQDLHMGKNPNTVIVPTSIEQSQSPTSDTPTQDGVDASQFYDCLETLCDRYKHNYPPTSYLKQILHKVERVTFFGFLMAIVKHEGINCKLGIPGTPGSAAFIKHSLKSEGKWQQLLHFHASACKHGNPKVPVTCSPSGIVPNKGELFKDSEMDQELEKFIDHILSNPTTNTPTHKETTRKTTHRKTLPHRKKVDIESDGSTEETDSSEN